MEGNVKEVKKKCFWAISNTIPTVVADGSNFGGDVDDNAAVLLGFLCGLLTETTSTLLQEGGKVLGHDQRAHCVGRQGGNDALIEKIGQSVQIKWHTVCGGCLVELKWTNKWMNGLYKSSYYSFHVIIDTATYYPRV